MRAGGGYDLHSDTKYGSKITKYIVIVQRWAVREPSFVFETVLLYVSLYHRELGLLRFRVTFKYRFSVEFAWLAWV
jgi:hypothetical protein